MRNNVIALGNCEPLRTRELCAVVFMMAVSSKLPARSELNETLLFENLGLRGRVLTRAAG